MKTNTIFKFIVAAYFFPKYASDVVNWKHKCRGKNGRGNPVGFTDEDIEHIRRGLKQLFGDLK